MPRGVQGSRARINTTVRESTPTFPPLPRTARGRAERRADRARRPRLRAARLLRLRHRDAGDRRARRRRRPRQPLPRHRRCAPRRAPASSPAATTTRSAWASSPTSRSGSPGYNGRIPTSRPRRCRASCATRATARSRSASGTSRRGGSRARRARSTGGRSASASSATTASSTATRTSGPPTLVRDNGFVEPPRRPEEGYHLTEDLADQAIRDAPGPAAGHAATSRSSSTSRPARPTRRTRRRRSGSSATAVASTTGGRRGASEIFARQVASGIVPARHRRSPTGRRGLPRWDELPADQRRLFARMMEVFAGFLAAHRRADRAGARVPRRARRRSTTRSCSRCSDNGTSAEGGRSARSTSTGSSTTSSTISTTRSPASTSSVASARTTTTRGAGRGPATRRCGCGSATRGSAASARRSIVRWPRGIAARGEIRSQFCHAIDVLPPCSTRSGSSAPDVGRRRRPSNRSHGASAAAHVRRRRRRRRRVDTQYFEMLGSRAIVPRRLEGDDRPRRPAAAAIEVELVPGSHDFDDGPLGAVPTSTTTSPRRTTSSAEHPEKAAELVERWWAEAGRNNVLPIADSFLGRVDRARAVAARAAVAQRCSGPGGGPVSEDALPAARCRVPAHGRARRSAPTDGRRPSGVLCALGDWSNGWALFVRRRASGGGVRGRSASEYPSGVAGRARAGRAPGRPSSTERDRGAAGGPVRPLGRRRRCVAEGRHRRHLPIRWQIGGGGLLVGRDAGFPVIDDYAPPAPFTGTLHRIELVIPALAPPDTREELVDRAQARVAVTRRRLTGGVTSATTATTRGPACDDLRDARGSSRAAWRRP